MRIADDRISRRLSRQPNGCVIWTGSRNPDGYGKVSVGGRDWIAHRFAWHLAIGPIPDGLLVLHKCDNPPCCNVAHLYLGTVADNTRDRVERGRSARGLRNGAYTHPERRARNRGEAAGSVRLTADQVRAMRVRSRQGESQGSLAEAFGVNRSTVSLAVRGVTWADLE